MAAGACVVSGISPNPENEDIGANGDDDGVRRNRGDTMGTTDAAEE